MRGETNFWASLRANQNFALSEALPGTYSEQI